MDHFGKAFIRNDLRARFSSILETVERIAHDTIVVVVADSVQLEDENPLLRKVRFAERTIKDNTLAEFVRSLNDRGIWTRVLRGPWEFVDRLTAGDLFPGDRPIQIVYDITEGGGNADGFGPARRATIPLLCRRHGLAHTNSNAYGAVISRHKYHQSLILNSLGIPAPESWCFHPAHGWVSGIKPPDGTKVICKPVYEAWALGVSERTVTYMDPRLEDLVVEMSEGFAQPICVQRFIDGREICVPLLEHDDWMLPGLLEATATSGPKPNGSYIAFEDSARPGGIKYRVVTDLPDVHASRLAALAIRVFEALDMAGYGRVDFRVTDDNQPYVIDIADNPGFDRFSAMAKALEPHGISSADVVPLLLGVNLLRLVPLDSTRVD